MTYAVLFSIFKQFFSNKKSLTRKSSVRTRKSIKECAALVHQIKEAIDSIKNNKNESNIYPSFRSIRLMKLLYDIRMSWNMKFSFEK
jgi:hypothetical protein